MISHIVCCKRKSYSIFIQTINTTVKSVLRHKNSFTSQEYSSAVVFRATTRLCQVEIYCRIARIFVLLFAHVKTAVYQGLVMQTRAVFK